jgi:hypothetical protein
MAIRLVLFEDRPHTMLVFVPETDEGPVELPVLQCGFA